MKEGDVVYIKAVISENPNGRMVRCVTAEEGNVVWCVPEELVSTEINVGPEPEKN